MDMKTINNTHRLVKILSVLLLFATLLNACASSNQYSYATIKGEFQNMQNSMISGEYLSEKDQQLAYAELFQKISKGSVSEVDQFAELVRTITNNAVEFDSLEVFTLAADYSKLFSDLANGQAELGIQDIAVTPQNASKTIIEISYFGEIRYSTTMVAKGESWNNGEELVPYNNELGQYLVGISFYDSVLSSKFMNKHPNAIIHDLGALFENADSNFLLKGVHTADHGYIIYIGSDFPFSVDTQTPITLNRPISSIVIEMSAT